MQIQVQTDDNVFDVELSYTISGRYIPATRLQPEEYPDVEWEIETVTDLDGEEHDDAETLEAVRKKLIDMDIESEILNYAKEQAEEYRADELYDRYRDEGF